MTRSHAALVSPVQTFVLMGMALGFFPLAGFVDRAELGPDWLPAMIGLIGVAAIFGVGYLDAQRRGWTKGKAATRYVLAALFSVLAGVAAFLFART